MKEIKIVIASGSDSWCVNCQKTKANLDKVLKTKFPALTPTIDHVNATKPDTIKKYGTLLAPTLIINDTIINEGSIPTESIIEKALKQILKE